jgi:branched-chain amino acid transport system substrate-binding protein
MESKDRRTLRSAVLASSLALMMVVAACQMPGAAGPAGKSGSDPIKIGALISTTGTLAPFGNDSLPGAQIYVDEVNARGGINGRQLQLIHVDDESKPELTVSAAKRLIQQDKVVSFIGPVSQIVTAAALPVFSESQIPSINCGCLFGPLEPYWFTTFPSIGMMKNQADFAKARGYTEIAVIAQAGALAEAIKATNLPELEAEGIKIVAFEQFQITDADLTPVLARVRAMGAKHVYVAASGVQAATAAKNFKQIQYPGYYWTFAGNANDIFINLVGEAADIVNVAGTKILVYKDLPANDPAKARLAAFAEKYQAKTGREPGTYAAFFYDIMTSLGAAIEKAGDDPQKIREALETQTGLQVLNGTINRNAKEHNGLNPEWLSVGIDPATKKFVIKNP